MLIYMRRDVPRPASSSACAQPVRSSAQLGAASQKIAAENNFSLRPCGVASVSVDSGNILEEREREPMPAIGAHTASPCIIASLIIMHMPVIRIVTPMIVITHLNKITGVRNRGRWNWSYGCGI
jgi:hypothetical protein